MYVKNKKQFLLLIYLYNIRYNFHFKLLERINCKHLNSKLKVKLKYLVQHLKINRSYYTNTLLKIVIS